MDEQDRTQLPILPDDKAPDFSNFSLLYPQNSLIQAPDASYTLTDSAWHDLGIDQIVAAFTAHKDHQRDIQRIFTQLIFDHEIIHYRQDILEDLLQNPGLAEQLNALVPVIDALADFTFQPEREMNTLHEVSWRIGELQSIIDCIEGLEKILADAHNKLTSGGLQTLSVEVRKVKGKPVFQNLVKTLPDLLAQLRSCASITIGVNLDAKMRPIEATLLAVHAKPFTNQSLLNKVFGSKKDHVGIAPLHSVPQRMVNGPYAFDIDPELGRAMEPSMVPLFADLAKVVEKITAPIASQLKTFVEIHSDFLVNLRQSLVFYLGAVHFIQRMHGHGLAMCRPEIVAASDRTCQITNSYNVNLAIRLGSKGRHPDLQDRVVLNNIDIGPEGQILILTGPNQGGKTTYMVGVGIAQLLAQIGCYVPGERAQISPVDTIYTHFPLEEKPEAETGRFGEEAMRLGKIFQQVTGRSLVLLNESLSSTSFGESLYLALDIARILRRIGTRAIYSTHLHELADRVGALNDSVPGDSKIISLVSSPIAGDIPERFDEVKRSYKVEARPPLGQSYAREIAARYGIRYEQLERILTERGVIPGEGK